MRGAAAGEASASCGKLNKSAGATSVQDWSRKKGKRKACLSVDNSKKKKKKGNKLSGEDQQAYNVSRVDV